MTIRQLPHLFCLMSLSKPIRQQATAPLKGVRLPHGQGSPHPIRQLPDDLPNDQTQPGGQETPTRTNGLATCQTCGAVINPDCVCTVTWRGRSMGLCLGCAGEAIRFLRREQQQEARRQAAALRVGGGR